MTITALVQKLQQFCWKCPGVSCISFLYYLSYKNYPSVGWTFSQNFISLAFPDWDWQCIEDILGKGWLTEWMNEWMTSLFIEQPRFVIYDILKIGRNRLTYSLNLLMNHEGVCETQGLLIIFIL